MLSKFGLRLANLALRGLALVSRLLLIVVLAKLITPAEVGAFGLFAATVSFSMLIIGGDFYAYSQRELLSSPQECWSFILQHQILATALLYIVLLPLQGLIFWLDIMPRQLVVWFFPLLIAEHIAQEINRLLIALNRQLLASATLFLRLGLWTWIVAPLMSGDSSLRNLDTVFAAWLIGCTLAIALGGSIIWWIARPWRIWHIDKAWIKRGLVVGMAFLVASMSFRALQTFDRYVVEYFANADFLGVYVVYAGMAMAVINILEPAVFSFLYPRLVSTYRSGDMDGYRNVMRELALSATGLSILVALAVALFAPYLFTWIGKPIYMQQLEILWLLLVMAVIYAVGMIPHYGLYARGADTSIMFAHVVAVGIFAILSTVVGPHFPRGAAPLGLMGAFSWLAIFKTWRYLQLSRNSDDSISHQKSEGQRK